MYTGVELPESQHQQFSGRVHLDKDALRRGQMRLHLSRVTAEDSGEYWCELAANYDNNKNKWELTTIGKWIKVRNVFSIFLLASACRLYSNLFTQFSGNNMVIMIINAVF